MTSDTLAPAIESAELAWRDGVPESSRFGDVYFSRDNGLEETRYVFLAHNRLPERFRSVPAGGRFVVAETGFGTGLNFLATWQAWRERAPGHPCVLHFVSAERYPLTRHDLQRALALWPELEPLARQLLAQYPPLVRGTHRLVFDQGRVRLTLHFGDVLEAWQALTFQANAWFLDGFAPALNPEMWLEQAMSEVRRHSAPGATLATFTAVGRVRRALAAQGFAMRKTPGFGRKREMLAGTLNTGPEPPSVSTDRDIVIVGAGIAGTLLARNLAERGFPVTLLDAQPQPGQGASGNRQGALYVKLGVEFNDQTELALGALTFGQRYYHPYQGRFWHPTGLLQLAWSSQEQSRQQRFLDRNRYPEELLVPVDAEQASRLAGLPVDTGGLWFPGGGWLTPSALCQALAQHPRITLRQGAEVTRLTPCNGQWHLACRDGGGLVAGTLVITAGHQSPALLPLAAEHRFKAIRGQVTHLPEPALRHRPRAVVCGQKYLNPCHEGIAVTGATFDLHENSPHPSADSHRDNLGQLDAMLPGLLAPSCPAPETVEGRVGFRCTTHDYQPVAGPLHAAGHGLDGVYVLTGLGSKGLAYGPLLAEYLADRISGQPHCLPDHLARRVHPGRMFRAAARGGTTGIAETGTSAVK